MMDRIVDYCICDMVMFEYLRAHVDVESSGDGRTGPEKGFSSLLFRLIFVGGYHVDDMDGCATLGSDGPGQPNGEFTVRATGHGNEDRANLRRWSPNPLDEHVTQCFIEDSVEESSEYDFPPARPATPAHEEGGRVMDINGANDSGRHVPRKSHPRFNSDAGVFDSDDGIFEQSFLLPIFDKTVSRRKRELGGTSTTCKTTVRMDWPRPISIAVSRSRLTVSGFATGTKSVPLPIRPVHVNALTGGAINTHPEASDVFD